MKNSQTLKTLAGGTRFRDQNNQVFEALGERRLGWRKRVFYGVRCISSPFKAALGPVSSAFFTSPGSVLWLSPNQPVEVLP
jgi:hypothetical protein